MKRKSEQEAKATAEKMEKSEKAKAKRLEDDLVFGAPLEVPKKE